MIKNIFGLAIFEVRKRSLNTYAGWVWSLLNPLTSVAVLYFVMSQLFKANIEHMLLFLISGYALWITIQCSILKSCNSLINRRDLMQNNNISPFLLVGADMLSEIFILLPLFFIGAIIAFFDGTLSIKILMLPYVLIVLSIFLFGIGLLLATLTPLFRDIPHLVGVALQALFWLTPIAYAKTALTGFSKFLIQLNPLTYYIELAQCSLLNIDFTSMQIMLPLLLSVISLVIGLYVSIKIGKKTVIFL